MNDYEGEGLPGTDYGIDKKIYVGGHGAAWSLRQVLEKETFERICTANKVAFKRTMFWTNDHAGEELDENGFIHGPRARHMALTELLEHGSLGVGTVEVKGDGITYVTADWCFMG